MPGVEGMVADTVEPFLRQFGLILHQNLVEVLIMAEGQLDLVQTTVWLVDPIFSAA